MLWLAPINSRSVKGMSQREHDANATVPTTAVLLQEHTTLANEQPTSKTMTSSFPSPMHSSGTVLREFQSIILNKEAIGSPLIRKRRWMRRKRSERGRKQNVKETTICAIECYTLQSEFQRCS